jgi:hypothetical protein
MIALGRFLAVSMALPIAMALAMTQPGVLQWVEDNATVSTLEIWTFE